MPEVLNVHVNENNKKIYFFLDSFSSSEKLTFENENVIFFNAFKNFNLFYLIVVIFCKFRLYKRSELQVHNGSKKKSTFFRKIFFSSSEKLS